MDKPRIFLGSSGKQKKLLEELRKSMPVDELVPRAPDSGQEKPFFEKVKDLFG